MVLLFMSEVFILSLLLREVKVLLEQREWLFFGGRFVLLLIKLFVAFFLYWRDSVEISGSSGLDNLLVQNS